MDRHEAKSSRPSLLSGAGPASASLPASGRILANMENRKEPRARAPRSARRAPALVIALTLALTLAAGGYWLLRADGHGPPAAQTATANASGATDVPSAPAPAAVIVDAAPEAEPTPFSPSETDVAMADAGETASPFADAPAAATPTRRASSPPAPSRSRATARSGLTAPSDKTDLLAILLHNIEQSPASVDNVHNRRTPMDELAQQIHRQGTQQQGAPSRPPHDVQALLRKCPKANTTQGLLCRQKVCARFAGKDPACPAPQ